MPREHSGWRVVARLTFYTVWSVLALVGLVTASGAVWTWVSVLGPLKPPYSDTELGRQLGVEFGKRAIDVDCLPEAIGRLDECGDDFHCQLYEAEFVRACLTAAEPTSDLCEGVPSRENELVGRQWREARCDAFTGDPYNCANKAYQVQRHCDARRRGKK